MSNYGRPQRRIAGLGGSRQMQNLMIQEMKNQKKKGSPTSSPKNKNRFNFPKLNKEKKEKKEKKKKQQKMPKIIYKAPKLTTKHVQLEEMTQSQIESIEKQTSNTKRLVTQKRKAGRAGRRPPSRKSRAIKSAIKIDQTKNKKITQTNQTNNIKQETKPHTTTTKNTPTKNTTTNNITTTTTKTKNEEKKKNNNQKNEKKTKLPKVEKTKEPKLPPRRRGLTTLPTTSGNGFTRGRGTGRSFGFGRGKVQENGRARGRGRGSGRGKVQDNGRGRGIGIGRGRGRGRGRGKVQENGRGRGRGTGNGIKKVTNIKNNPNNTNTKDKEVKRETVKKPFYEIKIQNFLREGEGRKQFTSYHIDFKSIATGGEPQMVKRRYSDFVWLRTNLALEAPQFIVPIVPSKGKDRFNPQMIFRRIRAFERFINRISEHPLWEEFATPKIERQENQKKKKKKGEKEEEEEEEEQDPFRRAINRYLTNHQEMDPDILEKRQNALGAFEKSTEKLYGTVTQLVDIKIRQGELFNIIPDKLHSVVELADPIISESELWISFADTLNDIADLFDMKTQQEKEVVGDAFSEFFRQSFALREPFAVYSKALEKKNKIKKEYEIKAQKIEKNKSSKESRAYKDLRAFEKKKLTIEKEYNDTCKILTHDLKRFDKLTILEYKKTLLDYAMSQYSFQRSLLSMFKRFVDTNKDFLIMETENQYLNQNENENENENGNGIGNENENENELEKDN
ncbi:sorting nexin [Anaeramoeba flamelloides]|uniref:Sorting nexin n=1 Tax=Anaeramoeba flamelloides TaxID=1746091 RepID=A0ABQ8YU04_9EUKA|nr:sorting nexin [Anaeramoeba flamelloides]